MQPKQVHNWSYSKESKGYILVFDKYFTNEFPLELMDIAFFDLKQKNIQLLKPLFKNLIEESNQGNNVAYDCLFRFSIGNKRNERTERSCK
tara:strand:+ start:3121 stop:3393 length:273 start_codon:yes stop_codon:yes gene_type:complete